MILALFTGWIISQDSFARELELAVDHVMFKAVRIVVKFIAPIAILSVFIFSMLGGNAA